MLGPHCSQQTLLFALDRGGKGQHHSTAPPEALSHCVRGAAKWGWVTPGPRTLLGTLSPSPSTPARPLDVSNREVGESREPPGGTGGMMAWADGNPAATRLPGVKKQTGEGWHLQGILLHGQLLTPPLHAVPLSQQLPILEEGRGLEGGAGGGHVHFCKWPPRLVLQAWSPATLRDGLACSGPQFPQLQK